MLSKSSHLLNHGGNMKKTIAVATNNKNKLKEIKQMLESTNLNLKSLEDLGGSSPKEDKNTFIENSIIKARYLANHSGFPTLADDSGLVVPDLNGMPGVISARFAGNNASDENNRKKLTEELIKKNVKEAKAYFYSLLVFFRYPNDPAPIITEGKWHGIIRQFDSGKNGFGYDPMFFIPELGKTSAEMDPVEKNKISHRGKAMRKMLELLKLEHISNI